MPLLWLDLETTGLSPTEDFILEVAYLGTDMKLRLLHPSETTTSNVVQTADSSVWARLAESEYVTKMHTDSGLVDALDRWEGTTPLFLIEREIVSYMELHDDGNPWQLAGASVHFDLAFIRTRMPFLARQLSHRVYDTSTLKAFFESLNMHHDVVNEGQHRAANDVAEVLEVARRYRASVQKLTNVLASEGLELSSRLSVRRFTETEHTQREQDRRDTPVTFTEGI